MTLLGKQAFVEDSTALGSNSALNGLASIGSAGALGLYYGAAVSTTGALTSNGSILIDTFGSGESSLTVAGALTTTSDLSIGNSALSAMAEVTAASLDNTGEIFLTGNNATTNLAALNVSGATTNNGSVSIATDTEELAGAVDGAGSFSLSTANLQFDSSVSAGQTINETGADELTLKEAQSFLAAISGFGTGDRLTRRTFSCPERRSISSRIRRARAARSPCTTGV